MAVKLNMTACISENILLFAKRSENNIFRFFNLTLV